MAAQPGNIQETFASTPFASHGERWDKYWREDNTPWDRGGPSLALHDLLHQRPDLVPPSQDRDHRGNLLRGATGAVKKKTALVPGCGRGHDVLLLSAWGYDVWGLDYSEAARKSALEYQDKAEREGLHRSVDELENGAITWVTGDFFKDEWNQGAGVDGKFDLIFDYTVCFSPPSLRRGLNV